jgi:hypothetical protein
MMDELKEIIERVINIEDKLDKILKYFDLD